MPSYLTFPRMPANQFATAMHIFIHISLFQANFHFDGNNSNFGVNVSELAVKKSAVSTELAKIRRVGTILEDDYSCILPELEVLF